MSVHLAGRTDVGLIREHNEDGFLVVDLAASAAPAPSDHVAPEGPLRLGDRGALLVVCDGMGGAAAGEVASSMALSTVSSLMLEWGAGSEAAPPEERKAEFARRVRSAAFEANRRIFEAAQADSMRAGMGTTMTCVGVLDESLVMVQVGDSRAYVMRDGVLTQMTRDQSLVNQLLELGQITEEQALLFEHSNVILQALGVQEDVEILLSTLSLRRGDRLVVCSDGLTGEVTDEELAAVLGSTPDMDEVARILVEMAREAGGRDNITVLAARFDDERLPAPGPGDELAYHRWFLDEVDPSRVPPPEPVVEVRQALPSPPREARQDPARTFLSLMVMLALALGGMVLVKTLARSRDAVECRLSGPPGQDVRVDGLDTGCSTGSSGRAELRLPAGSHRIGVRSAGAGGSDVAVDVRQGTPCVVSFDAPR